MPIKGGAYRILIVFLCLSSISWSQQTRKFNDPEYTYNQGVKLFQKEKYGAAKKCFEEYVSQNPNTLKSASAEYYASVSALYLEQPDAEKKIIFFSENNSEHPKSVFAYFELGNYYYNQNNYTDAIRAYEQVDAELIDSKQRDEMRFKLAYSYFSKKQFNLAKPLFDRIKNHQHQYRSAATYYAGYIAFQNEDYNAAFSDFINIKGDPAYKKIVSPSLVMILYKQGKYRDLLEYAEKENVKGGKTDLYMAESYFFLKDYSNARKNYEKYFNKSSRAEDEVNYRFGYTLLMKKKYAPASERFKKSALGDDELGQNSAYNLGICYLNLDRKDYALGAFLHASELSFDKDIQEEALVSYAKLNFENSNFQEAIRTFDKLNKEHPNSSHYKENEELLTEALVNSNNHAQAIKYLEGIKSMTYREKIAYQKASYKLGVELYNKEQYKDAVNLFKKSLNYPIDKDILLASTFWIAETYAKGSKYDDAIAMYARVFENDPLKTSDYYLKARYGIGYAYYNTKRYDKAINHFNYFVLNNKAKSKSEKLYDIDANVRLADCYYVSKNYGRAINEYRQVKAQQSLHLDYVSFQLGVIEYLDGRTEQAKADLDEIIKDHKNSPYYDDALFQRAIIDLENGAFAAAVAGFSDLIDYKPNNNLVPIAHVKRAIAYGNLQQNDKELNDYIIVIKNHVTHPIAYTVIESLPQVLAKQGKEDEFDNYLTMYKKANPNSSDLSAVEFESAKTIYFAGRYESAIKSFTKYISTHQGTAQAFEGEYYLAESYSNIEDIANAMVHYEQVVKDNQSEYVIRSIYKVAELYYENEQYQKAIEKYNLLNERGQRGSDIMKALRGLVRSYFKVKDCDNTIKTANQLLESGLANDDLREECKLLIAKCTINNGNIEAANSTLKEIVENNTGEVGAEANYILAKIQYDAQEYDHSIEILHAMNKSYADFEYWVGKSYLLIAKNLIAKGEDFQAKATLNSIIQYSKIESITEEAKMELQMLEQKVEEEKAVGDSVETINIDSLINE